MLKKINMNCVSVCILALVLSNVCYAETWSYIDTMQCSPSVEKAGWVQINGKPNAQLSIATIGIEKKGVEEIIVDWDGYCDDNDVCDASIIAHVIAKCELSGTEKKMYSFKHNTHAPSISCQKGEGILMRFLRPNDIDPDKYVFKYKMTVVRDDAQVKKIDGNQVEQNIENNIQLINKAVTQSVSSSGSGLGW